MRRVKTALLILPLLAVTACAHASKAAPVNEGPPVEFRFAPPPGNVQREQYLQRRVAHIDFEGKKSTTAVDIIEGIVEERYQPLRGGGWRVSSTVLEENATRNGAPITSPLPMKGVTFTHRIDAQGNFVAPEDLFETLTELQNRVADKRLADIFERVLTIEALTAKMERAWTARFAGVCGETLQPGRLFFALDEQDLPVGGTMRSVVQQQYVGPIEGETTAGMRLTFGGRGERLLRQPEARRVLDEAELSERLLAPSLKGEGERWIDPATCQTVREVARIKGELKLDRDAAKASGMSGFPERIRYEIGRELRRAPVGVRP